MGEGLHFKPPGFGCVTREQQAEARELLEGTTGQLGYIQSLRARDTHEFRHL